MTAKPVHVRTAPLGDYDVLEQVIPAAKKRGMKTICWYEDVFRRGLPGVESMQEVELSGKKAVTLCFNNPNYHNWLLDIALAHLTLGRAALYEAILEGTRLDLCRESLQYAVDGLRCAGAQHHLPRGLFTRAWLRCLTGARTGQESAQRDLNEAFEIAERGPMPLFMADIHLHRARLFGLSKDRPANYPWTSPQHDLDEARRLVEKHGYRRRKEELEDAEAVSSVGD